MPSKRQNIRVIKFPPDEVEPVCIAARAASRMVVGVSAKTFANWRSQKIGPPYVVIDGSVYYPWQEFKAHFSRGAVQTFNGRKE